MDGKGEFFFTSLFGLFNSASSPGFLMNSKSEYKQVEVARVVLVRGLSD